MDSAVTTIRTVGDLRRHLQYFDDELELLVISSELGERTVSFISATYIAGSSGEGIVRLYLTRGDKSGHH
jgi:hypothetical protein